MDLFKKCEEDANLERRSRTLELQTAMFVVQEHLPFAIADDMVDFLKRIDIDQKYRKRFLVNAPNVQHWFAMSLVNIANKDL